MTPSFVNVKKSRDWDIIIQLSNAANNQSLSHSAAVNKVNHDQTLCEFCYLVHSQTVKCVWAREFGVKNRGKCVNPFFPWVYNFQYLEINSMIIKKKAKKLQSQ